MRCANSVKGSAGPGGSAESLLESSCAMETLAFKSTIKSLFSAFVPSSIKFEEGRRGSEAGLCKPARLMAESCQDR